MKVSILSVDWSSTVMDQNGNPEIGGSGWVRLGQYVKPSRHDVKMGTPAFHSDIGRFGVHLWGGNYDWDADVIVMQRLMAHGVPGQIRIAQGNGQTIIQDIDDWYWGLDPQNKAFKGTDPKRYPDNNREHYRKSLSVSDGVLVSTPYLAGRLLKYVSAPRLHVNRNCVDFDRFPKRTHTANETVIGWVGSTLHRSGDLFILRGVLNQVQDRFKFHYTGQIPGAPTFDEHVGISGENLTVIPSIATDLYPLGFPFDIGLVPLADKPFNHAKSSVKGLEYTAAGIPFIASPSSEYVYLNEEYGVGRIARKPKDWLKHLKQLEDPELRAAEAKENLERVQKDFSLESGSKRFDDIIEKIASQ